MSIAAQPSQSWVPVALTFGARLAMLRQAVGWPNIKEAALSCGLPVETWRTWEKDGRTPRNIVEVARRIADATGCDYYWLLDGTASPEAVGVVRGTAQHVLRAVDDAETTKAPRVGEEPSEVATGRVELPTFRFSVERSTN